MITYFRSQFVLLSLAMLSASVPVATARSFTAASFIIQQTDGSSKFSVSPSSITIEQGGMVSVTNATDTAEYVSSSILCGGQCTQLIQPGSRATFTIPINANTKPSSAFCGPENCGGISFTILPKSKMAVDQNTIPGANGNTVEYVDPTHPAAPSSAPEGSDHLHNGAPLPNSGPAQTLGVVLAISAALFLVLFMFVKGARLG